MSIYNNTDNTDRQNIYAREDKTDTFVSSVVKPPTAIIESGAQQSDEALTFARQLRTRFADCRLTYHAIGDVVRGKRPYWWAEVAR